MRNRLIEILQVFEAIMDMGSSIEEVTNNEGQNFAVVLWNDDNSLIDPFWARDVTSSLSAMLMENEIRAFVDSNLNTARSELFVTLQIV